VKASVLDLRLEKIFKIGASRSRLALYADITNVFNADAATDLQYRVPDRVIGHDTVGTARPPRS
jgi:hypothetical protein